MLPVAFTHRIQQQLGNEYGAFIKALADTPPVSIRLNPEKISKSLSFVQVPWASHAYYLPERPVFAFDPLWHAGAYYVQEAGSMLLETVFKQLHFEQPNIKVLDVCAAPGGKSTHLLSMLQKSDLLVTNETIASRNSLLRENIIKWGHENVIVTQNDPKDFGALHHFFDVIVVDAPCSGEGLFRKDADAANQWSEANIDLCAARQQRIIHDILPALKPNGYLIYSTCTYNETENEQQSLWMQQHHQLQPIDIIIDKTLGIKKDTYSGLHCWPHKVKSEGFYIAAFQKNNSPIHEVKTKDNNSMAVAKKEKDLLNTLVKQELDLIWIKHQENYHAFPEQYKQELYFLLKHLYVKYFGVLAAQIKHHQLIPEAPLAFATLMQQNALNKVAVDAHTALNYLQRNTLDLTLSNGWHIITYQSILLGFVKSIQGRINNYFPTEWRLRKELNRDEFWSLV